MAQHVSVQAGQRLVGPTLCAGNFVKLAAHHADDGSRRSAVAHHVAQGEQETVGRQFQNVCSSLPRRSSLAASGLRQRARVILEAVE